MHTTLFLISTLLIVLGGYLGVTGLRRVADWRWRRRLQLAILAAPLASLAIGVGGVVHFAGRACLLGAPRWDIVLMAALPLAMGLVLLGALGLGALRVLLLHRIIGRSGFPAPRPWAAIIDDLLPGRRLPTPRLLLCAHDQPLAFVCGVWRPTVLLSTWMIEHLDRRELEAVLAHELAHVARRDYPLGWVATVLRDAFCYLPTSGAVYRQLQREQELACDDLAVGVTARPLALAGALAKVWHAAATPRLAGAQGLIGAGGPLEERIGRLLAEARPRPADGDRRSRVIALGVGTATVAGLLAFQVANLVLLLAPLGCGPAASLGGG